MITLALIKHGYHNMLMNTNQDFYEPPIDQIAMGQQAISFINSQNITLITGQTQKFKRLIQDDIQDIWNALLETDEFRSTGDWFCDLYGKNTLENLFLYAMYRFKTLHPNTPEEEHESMVLFVKIFVIMTHLQIVASFDNELFQIWMGIEALTFQMIKHQEINVV